MPHAPYPPFFLSLFCMYVDVIKKVVLFLIRYPSPFWIGDCVYLYTTSCVVTVHANEVLSGGFEDPMENRGEVRCLYFQLFFCDFVKVFRLIPPYRNP